jgi:hypothetical protein
VEQMRLFLINLNKNGRNMSKQTITTIIPQLSNEQIARIREIAEPESEEDGTFILVICFG